MDAGAESNHKGSADLLRGQFGIHPGQFCIFLIGKDGEEKRRWESMVGFGVIFSFIDAMPMRQREMKEKNSGPYYRGYGDKIKYLVYFRMNKVLPLIGDKK